VITAENVPVWQPPVTGTFTKTYMFGNWPVRDNAYFSVPNYRLYLEVNKNWCN